MEIHHAAGWPALQRRTSRRILYERYQPAPVCHVIVVWEDLIRESVITGEDHHYQSSWCNYCPILIWGDSSSRSIPTLDVFGIGKSRFILIYIMDTSFISMEGGGK